MTSNHRVIVLGLIFSFFLMGIPVWYKTTQVYRATLPTARLNNLALTVGPIPFHHKIKPLDIQFKFNFHVFTETEVNLLDVQTTLASKNTSDLYAFTFSSEREKIPNKNGIYSIQLDCHNLSDYKRIDINVSATRLISIFIHGSCNSKILSESLLSLVSSIFYFSSKPNEESVSFKKTMKYSAEYNVVFSLLLEDPNLQNASWDIEHALNAYVIPFKKTLAPISELQLSAQTIYHAPLHIKPVKKVYANRSISHLVKYEDISLFVNLAGWNLVKFASLAPPIRFILYVPRPALNPLHITRPDKSLHPSNAFMVPRWGGLKVFNPPTNDTNFHIGGRDLHGTIQLFIFQLRELMGVEQVVMNENVKFPFPVKVFFINSPKTGITLLELDQILRKRLLETVKDARETLISLYNLISSLENMVLLDTIVERVTLALDKIDETIMFVKKNEIEKAWKSSKEAFLLSDSAFFDPTMLALLYFPDEHKYAVYMPLFVPILFPVLSAIFKEFRMYRERRKLKID